ncbi:MAG: DUF3422 domain-containing protein [Polyangiaceae bacterium]|nr:DUF3422 domain-containing protein [Polyangiaceae bacterium]
MTTSEAPTLLAEHPLRRELNDELHARPPLHLDGPTLVLHLAALRGAGSLDDIAFLQTLALRFGAPSPDVNGRHGILRQGEAQLKWERHTEFTTYTLFVPLTAAQAEAGPLAPWAPLPPLATELVRDCPGACVAALVLEFRPGPSALAEPAEFGRLFPGGDVVASSVGGGSAFVLTDFRLDAQGLGRMLLLQTDLRAGRAGRMVQRLLEIETYRLMALLGLPMVRRSGERLAELEARLTTLVEHTSSAGAETAAAPDADDRRLLAELTRLAAEAAQLGATTRYRLGAGAAYAELVARRLLDIREGRVEGLSRLSRSLDRRFTPAMRTCEAFARRLDQLETGIDRASDLLRTRIDVNLQAQNGALLRAMEGRSRAQLRIQEAVEGLSAFAISYYLIGLLKVLAEGLLPEPEQNAHRVLAAVGVPIVLGAVWVSVRRLRQALKAEHTH